MPKDTQYYSPKGQLACDTDNMSSRCDVSFDEYEEDYKRFKKNLDEEHSRVVACANKSFGVNLWSHAISKQDIDCIDCVNGTYSIGAIAVVKVERKGGAYHEELGYGCCFGLKNKILSIAIARQEAVLDALVRAVGSFGESTCIDLKSVTEQKENIDSSFMVQKVHSKLSENAVGSVASTSGMPPRNSISSPPPNDALKAERKRKQLQLQEEFKRCKKIKEQEHGQNSRFSVENVQSVNLADDDEAAFISTQELDEMINSAGHYTSSAPLRAPMLSSPEKNRRNCIWMNPNNNCPR